MSGQAKLMTAGGGGVVLTPASSVASDVTLSIPSQNGTVVATDSNGNVGLGVTPSAWASGYSALQVKSAALWSSGVEAELTSNAVYQGAGVYKYIGSTNATKYEQYSGYHAWFTAPSGTAGNPITFTQAMTLDASGNLGIGTSSPYTKLQVGGTIRAAVDNTSGMFNLGDRDGATTYVGIFRGAANSTASGGNWLNLGGYDGIAFAVGTAALGSQTERMRIDSSGNLLVGKTSLGTGNTAKITTEGRYATWNTGSAAYMFGINGTAYTWSDISSGSEVERMRIDASGNLLLNTTSVSAVGSRFSIKGSSVVWGCGPTSGNDSFFVYNASSVGVYLGNGNTSWSSSSDERVKDIIEPISDAANKVSTLRAVIGKYKSDDEGIRRSFLIAQDVQAVLPEAVNVQKDEIGTLGLQYTDVIPLLVAAIKELKAELDVTKAEVELLKGTSV